MESIRLTPFFLALLLAGSLVIAANAQSTTTASPSVTGADSLEIVGESFEEDQEEHDRDLRLPGAPKQERGPRAPSTVGLRVDGPSRLAMQSTEDFNRNLRIPAVPRQDMGPRVASSDGLTVDGPSRLAMQSTEDFNRNLRLPPQPNPYPPPHNQPVCCMYCRSNDYNCLSNCVGDCREQDQCEGAGKGAYRAFCEEECPRTGPSMLGASSPLVPIEACRGMCKKEVQEMCVARACSDVVPGCSMSNCSSAAPAKCG